MAQIAATLRQEKELMNSSSQNLRGYALLLVKRLLLGLQL